MSPQTLSILGSTGSIGQQTLQVVAEVPEQYQLQLLSAQNNWQLLAEQAKQFRPHHVVIGEEDHYSLLKEALQGTGINVAAGETALLDAVTVPVDRIIAAIMGVAGLNPTAAALPYCRYLGLANKECLVSGGAWFMQEAAKHGAAIIPVDSEHSAIFQLLRDEHADQLASITLTASGGPFRDTPLTQLQEVSPEQALKHPNWEMGQKITIDSATMMNKGLECIEAQVLFNLPPEKIDVLIHPESLVHGLVQYADGSMLAQMGMPDMRTPIAIALHWPKRQAVDVEPLNLAAIGSLHFSIPDENRYPCYALARQVMQQGGDAAIRLNAANEVAVEAFLQRRLTFTAIAKLVEETIAKASGGKFPDSLESILATDAEARAAARMLVAKQDQTAAA